MMHKHILTQMSRLLHGSYCLFIFILLYGTHLNYLGLPYGFSGQSIILILVCVFEVLCPSGQPQRGISVCRHGGETCY